MWKQDENPYREETQRLHAPRELVERTRTAMQEETVRLEREKRKKMHRWGAYAAAACICIAALGGYGGYRYHADNFTVISEIEAAEQEDSWEAGLSLGKSAEEPEEDEHRQEEKVTAVSGEERGIAPEALWEVPVSRIRGQEVYIGRDKGTYYAAWEKEGKFWFVHTDEMKKEEFLKYLKEMI